MSCASTGALGGRGMLMRAQFSCALLLQSVLVVAFPLAFGQVVSRIGGTVRDSTDAVMQGVLVTVADLDRGLELTTRTNEAGRYSFPNMAVGDYRVTAEHPGFKKAASKDFKVDVNQS